MFKRFLLNITILLHCISTNSYLIETFHLPKILNCLGELRKLVLPIHFVPKTLFPPTLQPEETLNFTSQATANDSSLEKNSGKDINTQPNYCNNLLALNNQLLICRPNDYCCRVTKFENQFYKEEVNDSYLKNKTALYSNLKKCKNNCNLKLPNAYDCSKSSFNSKYKSELNLCYESCFINNYKCNNVSLNSGPKPINYGDIGLGLAFVILFCLCLARYTCCEGIECKKERRFSSSSTIHVEEIIVKENNV